MIALCILLGAMVPCETAGAIVPYAPDMVCDANGDCDDDAQCWAFGGACYADDGACWEEDR